MKPEPKNPPISKKQKNSLVVKFILTVIKMLIVLILLLGCAVAGIVGGAVIGYIRTAPPITDKQLELQNLTTFILDAKGNEIARLTGSENMDRIIVLDRDGNIPQHLKHAFIALEDERFLDHNGFDLIGFGRAVYNTVFRPGNVQGGSTITMQLVKNLTGEDDKTLKRKVQELWRAMQLERRLSKWEILELYMNLIPMGGNSYGVQAASYKYFGKPVKELSLAQCASLAAITNAPTYYAPITEKGRENNKKRQRICLSKMLELGYISQKEYEEALKEELQFVDRPEDVANNTVIRSYFADQVIQDVKRDMLAAGYSEQFASMLIYNGGLTIKTTMDPDIQAAMDEVFKNEEYFPGKEVNGLLPQAAMVILDPVTGEVKAMYGGRGEKTANSVLNRATQSKRQAGSTFKPIGVYGPAIDLRLLTAASVIDDVPVHFDSKNKAKIYPVNYNSRYEGLTTIRRAIANSVNVVAARAFMEYLGPDLSIEYLARVGIELDKSTDGYLSSLALGGLTHGVSALQMAGAYIPFANKGIYVEPITYTEVTDKDGKVILDKRKTPGIRQKTDTVYEEQTAFILTDMMRDTTSYGTASYVKLKNSKGQSIPVAAKTGTSSQDVDRWFVAYTPKLVGVVWYGYDKNIEVVVSGNNPAAVIWQSVMQKHYSTVDEAESFPSPPANVVKKHICIYSGKLAGELCGHDVRVVNGRTVQPTRDEYFIKGTEPRETCDVHMLVKVCKDSTETFTAGTGSKKQILSRNRLASPYCPPSSAVEKILVKRRVPFSHEYPSDPYPFDWGYEMPSEYCDVHTGPPDIFTGEDEQPEDWPSWEDILPPAEPAGEEDETLFPNGEDEEWPFNLWD